MSTILVDVEGSKTVRSVVHCSWCFAAFRGREECAIDSCLVGGLFGGSILQIARNLGVPVGVVITWVRCLNTSPLRCSLKVLHASIKKVPGCGEGTLLLCASVEDLQGYDEGTLNS